MENYSAEFDAIAKAMENITQIIDEFNQKMQIFSTFKNSLDPLKNAFIGATAVIVKINGGVDSAAEGISKAIERIKNINVDGIGDKFTSIFQKTSPIFSKIGGDLGKVASIGMGAFGKMSSVAGTILKTAISALAPATFIALALVGLGIVNSQFGSEITKILEMVKTKGPEIITNLVSGIVSSLPLLITSGTALLIGILGTINAILPSLFEGGIAILQGLISGLIANMPMLIESIVTVGTTIINGIVSVLPQLILMGIQILEGLISGIISNLPLIFDSAVNIIKSLVEGIVCNLPAILGAMVQLVLSIVSGIITNLPAILEAAATIISTLVLGIIACIPAIGTAIKDLITGICGIFGNTDWNVVGKNIIQGIANGLAGTGEYLWKKAQEILGGFKDKVLDFFGIHSPSRWGRDMVGRMIPLGIAAGIGKTAGAMEKTLVSAASTMASATMGTITDLQKSMGTAIDMNSIIGDANAVISTVSNVSGRDLELAAQGASSIGSYNYTFETYVDLDGKELGKGTAKYTKEELDKIEIRNDRIRGRK